MTPNSFAYIVFLVIGALIYHPLSQKAKKPFLLLLNFMFYAIGGVKFLPLLALTVAFNFFAAQKLERTERKRGLLALVLVLNLGALGLFKYLGFFGELLGCTGVQLSLPQLALPIGISFYTFVICGYMIDVYRGREAERNFLDFALFTTFFPAILSGPIERSKSLLPQFKQPRRANADDVRFAAERLIEGTVKKVLLADNLAILVNTAYADPAQFSGLELAFAAVAYALQIYCDFSAYSDMAIGSARLFGITLMENFHAPYMAQSSKEFWHRWHISLSTWFRDYLYFPLGGSRKGKARTYINVLKRADRVRTEWPVARCRHEICALGTTVRRFSGYRRPADTGKAAPVRRTAHSMGRGLAADHPRDYHLRPFHVCVDILPRGFCFAGVCYYQTHCDGGRRMLPA